MSTNKEVYFQLRSQCGTEYMYNQTNQAKTFIKIYNYHADE